MDMLLAAAYGQLGSLDDATWALEEVSVFAPGISLDDEREDSIHAQPDDLERYIDRLPTSELTDSTGPRDHQVEKR